MPRNSCWLSNETETQVSPTKEMFGLRWNNWEDRIALRVM